MSSDEIWAMIGAILILICIIISIPIIYKLLKYLSIGPEKDEECDKINNNPIQRWYNNMNNGQRMFVWIISICLIPFFLVGIIPLCVLIYCKLGMNKNY